MTVTIFLLLLCLAFLTVCIVAYFKVQFQNKQYDKSLQRNAELADKLQGLSNNYLLLQTTINSEVKTNNELRQQIKDLRAGHTLAIQAAVTTAAKAARADALKRAERVSHGFSGENFAPLLMDLNHKDFRHMGDPIDYIVIKGGEDVRRGDVNEVEELILLDIKTGKSDLSKIQRRIRDAVVGGRVSFATYNSDTNTMRYWPEKKDES